MSRADASAWVSDMPTRPVGRSSATFLHSAAYYQLSAKSRAHWRHTVADRASVEMSAGVVTVLPGMSTKDHRTSAALSRSFQVDSRIPASVTDYETVYARPCQPLQTWRHSMMVCSLNHALKEDPQCLSSTSASGVRVVRDSSPSLCGSSARTDRHPGGGSCRCTNRSSKTPILCCQSNCSSALRGMARSRFHWPIRAR